MFEFFLKSYRSGILTFGGSETKVVFDPGGEEGKYCFRQLENGIYNRYSTIPTRHPNIVHAVVHGKKSWGLWVDAWSDGIVDWTFTEEEILGQFQERGIQIPEPLLKDFRNRVNKKKRIRNSKYFEIMMKSNTERN